MKIAKKIALAVLAAMAFSFIGCELPDGSMTDIFQKKFGDDVFSYSDNDHEDGLGKWTINGKNESENKDKYVRGMQYLQTKHSDIAAVIEIEGQNGGVIGLAFDVTQNKDRTLENYKTYNFCLAGVRYYNNSVQYYVSYYANIVGDEMCELNFGACAKEELEDGTILYKKPYVTKDAVDPECLTPYEVEICTFTSIPEITPDENDRIKFVLDIDEISNKDEAADTYGAGSYFVNVYKPEAYNEKAMKFNADKEDYRLTDIMKGYVKASRIGKEGAAQAKVGVYANVYPITDSTPGTLKGTVKIADLTNCAVIGE